MYQTLMIFLVLYPFLIFPWGISPYYTLPKSQYLMYCTLILWVIFLIQWIRRKIVIRQFSKGEKIIFIFMILILISTLFSVDMNQSLTGSWHRYEGLSALFSYISFFFFSYRFISPSKYEKILQWFTFGSVFVSSYGILQHYKMDFLPRDISKLTWTRSYAFFDNPNFFGSYLVLVIAISMAFYLKEKENRKNVYVFVISIAFIAMLFTLTRSAWLAMIFIYFLFMSIVIKKRKQYWRKWVILSIILISLTVGINHLDHNQFLLRSNQMLNDVDLLLSDEDKGSAGSARWYIWEKSLPLVKEYFWIGSGPDTFGKVFPHIPADLKHYYGTTAITVDKAHNEYLQMAITLGTPALVVYLFFIWHILFRYLKRKSNIEEFSIIHFGLFVAVSGYLVQAFFNISVTTVAPFYWIFLGLLYRSVNPEQKVIN